MESLLETTINGKQIKRAHKYTLDQSTVKFKARLQAEESILCRLVSAMDWELLPGARLRLSHLNTRDIILLMQVIDRVQMHRNRQLSRLVGIEPR